MSTSGGAARSAVAAMPSVPSMDLTTSSAHPLFQPAPSLFYASFEQSLLSAYALSRKHYYPTSEWRKLLHDTLRTRTLYVGNLSPFTREEQLYELFARCGPIERITMGLFRATKTPFGFCFIIFHDSSSAHRARMYLESACLDHRPIHVDLDQCFEQGREFGRAKVGPVTQHPNAGTSESADNTNEPAAKRACTRRTSDAHPSSFRPLPSAPAATLNDDNSSNTNSTINSRSPTARGTDDDEPRRFLSYAEAKAAMLAAASRQRQQLQQQEQQQHADDDEYYRDERDDDGDVDDGERDDDDDDDGDEQHNTGKEVEAEDGDEDARHEVEDNGGGSDAAMDDEDDIAGAAAAAAAVVDLPVDGTASDSDYMQDPREQPSSSSSSSS